MKEGSVSIWFLIGLQLAIFGALILGSGLVQWFHPPVQKPVLFELHAGIWWGAMLTAVGLFYAIHFRPRRTEG